MKPSEKEGDGMAMKLSERMRKTPIYDIALDKHVGFEVSEEELVEVAQLEERLEEIVHLVQSKWEEFGCDEGVVTIKYPWAIHERMRELTREQND